MAALPPSQGCWRMEWAHKGESPLKERSTGCSSDQGFGPEPFLCQISFMYPWSVRFMNGNEAYHLIKSPWRLNEMVYKVPDTRWTLKKWWLLSNYYNPSSNNCAQHCRDTWGYPVHSRPILVDFTVCDPCKSATPRTASQLCWRCTMLSRWAEPKVCLYLSKGLLESLAIEFMKEKMAALKNHFWTYCFQNNELFHLSKLKI